MDNGRCRMHGGNAKRGAGSGTFKTGKYSKYLPDRLSSRYLEAVNDPELLALRDDIALIDARLAEVLGRIDTGESGKVWESVAETFNDLKVASRTGNANKATVAMRELDDLISNGLADNVIWSEIGELLEKRRRIIESERRRLIDMQQMITAENAMLLVAALVGVIREHVTDRGILNAISADIGKLTAVGDQRRIAGN